MTQLEPIEMVQHVLHHVQEDYNQILFESFMVQSEVVQMWVHWQLKCWNMLALSHNRAWWTLWWSICCYRIWKDPLWARLTADKTTSHSCKGRGRWLITCCTGKGKWITLPSSPNWPPGRITTSRNRQIKEIILTSSEDKDANWTGVLSGLRALSAAHDSHCRFNVQVLHLEHRTTADWVGIGWIYCIQNWSANLFCFIWKQ